MRGWVDIKPEDWYYHDVLEATNYRLVNGDQLVRGMYYDLYQTNQPRIYREFVAQEGQKVFIVQGLKEPTANNPLFVYVNGVQIVYKKIDGATVELYSSLKAKDIVTFFMPGVPLVDEQTRRPGTSGNPVEYPNIALQYGNDYIYNSLGKRAVEYLFVGGQSLRRAPISKQEWFNVTNSSQLQQLLRQYINFDIDIYAVSPPDHPYLGSKSLLFVPYNMNEVTAIFHYQTESGRTIQETIKCGSPAIVYNDRFFPEAQMLRKEVVALGFRLLESFFDRFTDTQAADSLSGETSVSYHCQKIVQLKFPYTAGSDQLRVYINGRRLLLGSEYTEFDDHTIILVDPLPKGMLIHVTKGDIAESKFADVAGNHEYWADPVRVMERLALNDGTFLIIGKTIAGEDKFCPDDVMTRGETVAFLNRLRTWCIERFRY